MADILRKALTGPSVWHGNQFTQDLSWIHELSEIDIGDLESALSHAKNTGVTPGKFSMNDFPLQAFGTKIKNLLDEVQNGRGFAIFRGLPVERYERSDLEIIFWGIGAYMGEVISQNSKGDLIAEVAHAIEMGSNIEDIALTVHAHPTLSETIGLSAEIIEGTITDM